MIPRLQSGRATLATAGLAVLLTAGSAAAQQQSRGGLTVPPPLQALGRALDGLRDRMEGAAGPGARTPARDRTPTPTMKRGTPAAQLKDARLPQPRPGRLSEGLPASAPPSVSVEAKPPPASAEARPPPPEPSARTAGAPNAREAPDTIPAIDRSARLPRARPTPQAPPAEGPDIDTARGPELAAAPADRAAPDAPRSAGAAVRWLGRTPRPRPAGAPTRLAFVQPDAQLDDDAPPLSPPIPALAADEAACLARIEALGVAFTREDAITDRGSCNVAQPLSVTSIGSGVAIAPAAILNCRTAEALALWARDVMSPAAEEHLDAKPNKLVNASAYVCRPRNNQAGARLSEHATANAFDISEIAFADRNPVAIEGRGLGEPEGRFQRAIREGSCRYFTTVLGPGSNAAHATHFHFDMARRRGGYRLCELGERTAGRETEKTKRE